MTVRIQGCVRTAHSSELDEGGVVCGLLTLSGGAWYFGYDITSEEVQIYWVPFVPLPLEPSAASMLFRLWNVDSMALQENPDTKALGVQPVLEQQIDLNELADTGGMFTRKLSLGLDEFLVFGFEGTGPAFGEQQNTGDNGLSEKLSAVQAELEQAKKESIAEILSLQAAFSAEREAKEISFEEEKAKLNDGFETKQAELQREIQDKTRDLEKQLSSATRELGKAKKDKERVEKQYAAMKVVENTLKEENLQVSRERDEIETKSQEFENEAYASNLALQDTRKVNEKQKDLIAALEIEKTNISADLANLLQTVVPENKRLQSEISLLQNAAKTAEEELEGEKTKAIEVNARLARLESSNRALSQELRKTKNSLAYSQNARSRLEGDNDRATARLKVLESESSKRQEKIQQLNQNYRAEKTGHEIALSELDRLKELMTKELSDAERNISNLHLKIAGLEKQVESATAEKSDLNIANFELKDSLSHEKAERQGAENNNERLITEADGLRGRIEAAEEQVSELESDLSAAKSKLDSYESILQQSRDRYAEVLFNLKSEKVKCAEAEGKLEAFESLTKTKISKLTDDLASARAEARQFADLCDTTKAELQGTKQKLATANFQLEKQERQLKTEAERNKKLEADLEKAFQRWLEYDKERLYEQLDNEREAHERCKEVLETAKAEHAANVSYLESEIKKMDNEIKDKGDKIRQHINYITDLEGKYQLELGLKAVLEGKVQDLEKQVSQLGASLTDEYTRRVQFENLFNQEASGHANTRQSLANETQRANKNGNQLIYANRELEYERSRAFQTDSELNDKKNELQQFKLTVANQRARIRALENSSKHDNCVTKDSVDKVIGSYERLYDSAVRRSSRRNRYTLYKAHYPAGFGWSNGKYFIRFRDEYV